MNIAVFGGASVHPDDVVYTETLRLGKMLGEHGFTVLTGSYIGVMEAASRGANEAGGHVVGMSCAEIENCRQVYPNRWVLEEHHYETLRERLFALIDGCDAAIVMPGGVGTLSELVVIWNEMIINSKPPRPLIVVGSAWQRVMAQFFESLGGYIGVKDRELIQLVPDVDTAVKILVDYQNQSIRESS